MRLFLLLVAIPIIEIALFIEVGGWLGTWPTIGIVILTALIGSILLRRQGLKALGDVQGRLRSGDDPGQLLADGAMILVAGVLLLTPGFFTDAIGFLLLVPGIRKWIYSRVSSKMMMSVNMTQTRAQGRPDWQSGGSQTVDADYEDVTPTDDPEPRPQNPDRDQLR